MVNAGSEQPRRRLRYPLQASFEVPKPPPSADPVLDNARHVNKDFVFATTESALRPVSQHSTLADEDGHPPAYKLPQSLQVNLESTTTASVSSRSASPSTESLRREWDLTKARGVAPTEHPPTYIQHEALVARSSSASSLDNPSSHFITTSTPPSEESHSPLHEPSGDGDGQPKRTLRRTPRSRRITSRGSLAELDEATISSHEPAGESESGSDTPDARAATNGAYPLQPDHQISNVPAPNAPSQVHEAEMASNVSSMPVGNTGDSSTKGQQRNRHVYPLNGVSTALPASPPSSDSEADSSPAPPQPEASTVGSGATNAQKPKQRRGYPLQAPASHVNLRSPLTPPPGEQRPEGKGNAALDTVKEEMKATATGNMIAHQADSLPTSANYVKSQSNSSFSHEREGTPADVLPRGKGDNATVAGTSIAAPRRQAYPLQSPASIANLKGVSTNENERPLDSSPSPNRENTTPAAKKVARRKAYPLQSPASTKNLRRSLSPLPENTTEPTRDLVTQQTSDNSRSPGRKIKSRRQGYPLQAPASILDLRGGASPLPSQAEQSPGTSTMLNASKKVSYHRAYPLQTPASTANLRDSPPVSPTASHARESWFEGETVVHESPTSSLSEADSDEGPDAEHLLLPRHIRSVKKAGKQDHKGRTIVVCLDGTGDKFDDDNSNIVHLVSALKKDDPNQVSYYQAGIGTYSDGGLSSGYAAAMDMAVGSGLGLHIRDAYQFLMHSYKEGDKICIFGFSRGAYTARCLAGMIHKVGLLPPRNIQQVMFAYEFYKNDTPEGWAQSEHFKRTFSINVNVYYIGCFDSVASVGWLPRQLPLSSTPGSKARYFRHAMSLDERRAKFKVCRYQKPKGTESQATKTSDEIQLAASRANSIAPPSASWISSIMPNLNAQDDSLPTKYSPTEPYGKDNHANTTQAEYDRLNRHEKQFDTDVSEVWFAGCHADIGGGAVSNITRHKLSQIPLRWMIRQCFECNTGIIFKTQVLAEYGLDVHTLWPKYEPLQVPACGPSPKLLERYTDTLPPRSLRSGKLVPLSKRHEDSGEHLFRLKSHLDEDWTPEQAEDYYDAISPMNDQLLMAPSWWILEMLPVEYKVSTKPGEVVTRVGPNWGQYRLVEDHEAKLHWTAVSRAQQMGGKVHSRPAAHTRWKIVA